MPGDRSVDPYAPPSATPAPEQSEHPVMAVRYGWAYRVLYVFNTAVFLLLPFTGEYELWMRIVFWTASTSNAVVGIISLTMPYFRVFPDRIEFPSPLFRKWQSCRPIEYVTKSSRSHRWVSNKKDFQRFLDWQAAHENDTI